MNKTIKWIVALSLLLATGCSDAGAEASTDMRGRLVAPECGGGYDVEQSQILLRNQDNKIIGAGNSSENLLGSMPGVCVVSFKIPDVPDAEFYTIEVGTHSGPAWSRSDLEKQDFKPALTLGDAVLQTSTQPEFCAAMGDLNSLLADMRTLNNDPDEWDASVQTASDTSAGFARASFLSGDEESGQKIADYAAAFTGIQTDSWYTVKAFNKAVDVLDAVVPGLDTQYECASGWQDHGFH